MIFTGFNANRRPAENPCTRQQQQQQQRQSSQIQHSRTVQNTHNWTECLALLAEPGSTSKSATRGILPNKNGYARRHSSAPRFFPNLYIHFGNVSKRKISLKLSRTLDDCDLWNPMGHVPPLRLRQCLGFRDLSVIGGLGLEVSQQAR